MKKYQLIIVGGGPGGYTAAFRAAELGMSVAIVDDNDLGGVCLNWGCIPTKSLLKNAEVFELIIMQVRMVLKLVNLNFILKKLLIKLSKREKDYLKVSIFKLESWE